MFDLIKTTPLGRRGRLRTAHGIIESPFFMPVGTGGAMKGLSHGDIVALGAEILLCNTYHLHLQPGEAIVERGGGLHQFIGWDKPILTDSGGFQVFSLATLRSIDDTGVTFRSPIDGSEHRLDPESAIRIQHALGADIIMCFDHCPPSTGSRQEVEEATERTMRWAKECLRVHKELLKKRPTSPRSPTKPKKMSSLDSLASSDSSDSPPLLFGIIQGGLERDLREHCAEELIAMGFDGYALGGLAVGETEAEMYSVLDAVCPILPKDKPRYLMGVGVIEQLRTCVAKGIDMFDCVLPMRLARHGELLLSDGSSYRINRSAAREDFSLIDEQSPSPLSRIHNKAYLHHLFKAGERYAETIACMQNLGVTLEAMRSLREQMDSE